MFQNCSIKIHIISLILLLAKKTLHQYKPPVQLTSHQWIQSTSCVIHKCIAHVLLPTDFDDVIEFMDKRVKIYLLRSTYIKFSIQLSNFSHQASCRIFLSLCYSEPWMAISEFETLVLFSCIKKPNYFILRS